MQNSKMNLIRATVAVMTFGFATLMTNSAHAVTMNVTTFVDEINVNGACSLREAIINANNNNTSGSSDCVEGDATGIDEIVLSSGTYTLSIAGRGEDAAQTGDLDITDVDTLGGSIVITGATATDGTPATIIDGGDIDRIFDIFNPGFKADLTQGANFDGVVVTLQNLKLVNGHAEETVVAVDNQANGGAVFSWRFNDLTINNCVFDNNQAVWDTRYGVIDPDTIPDSGDEIEERTLSGHGGAAYSRGAVNISGSTFSNNIAYTTNDENMDNIIEGENEKSGNGGGLFIAFTSTITDSSFFSNTASNGGGLNTTGGEPTIVPGNMTISGSTFNDNWAVMGGGVNNVSPQVTLDIINSTFSANTSTDMGAGINSDADVNLRHVTVVDNKVVNSDQNGAGINYFGPGGAYFLSNTLLSNNKGKSLSLNCGCTGGTTLACADLHITSNGGNISSDFNCALTSANGDLQGPNPNILALADNGGPTQTHALDHDSFAIDFGRDTNCITAMPAIVSDQRGVTRPLDGDADGNVACDSGAYERQNANTDLVLTDLSLSASSVDINKEISIIVSAGNTGPDVASSSRVDLVLPDELDFVSGSVAGGVDCAKSGHTISCALGDMNAAASSNITIVVSAIVDGVVSISATISALEADLDSGNNSAQVALTINPEVVATGSDDGGGFCAYHPDGKPDFVLPIMLLSAFGYLLWRRYPM